MTIKELYETAVKEGVENEQIIINDSDWGYYFIKFIYKSINPDGTLAGILLDWAMGKDLNLDRNDWIEIDIN